MLDRGKGSEAPPDLDFIKIVGVEELNRHGQLSWVTGCKPAYNHRWW